MISPSIQNAPYGAHSYAKAVAEWDDVSKEVPHKQCASPIYVWNDFVRHERTKTYNKYNKYLQGESLRHGTSSIKSN